MENKDAGPVRWVDTLLEATLPIRNQLTSHKIYHSLATLEQVHVFMENHVFAVWDFMSLVKSLQRIFTSVDVPWAPHGHPIVRRLINEIVLGEESDEDSRGGYLSHFELYLQAMAECEADTSCITAFVEMIGKGGTVVKSLKLTQVPAAARVFVETTWRIVESKSPHKIAAAFAIGREEIIPVMFRSAIENIQKKFPERMSCFSYYLRRHINIDKDVHFPMAIKMLENLCGEDPRLWNEAIEAAQMSLRARVALWDGVFSQISVL